MTRQSLWIVAFLSAGCSGSPTSPGQPATSSSQPGDKAAATVISSDKPAEFDKLIKAFEDDPAETAKKYRSQMLYIDMTVEAINEMGKDQYELTGTTGSVRVRGTFLVVPKLQANTQITALKPGNKAMFYARPDHFTPGKPRGELVVRECSITRVDLSAK